MSAKSVVTRFAPSPNGHLHLGHAYSAIVAHDLAHEAGGTFLLRIEDIDGPRSRPEFADEFRRDLEWLGLEWAEVPAQSTRLDSYEEAARKLVEAGVLYRCNLTRKHIADLPKRTDENGIEYPGSSRAICEQHPIAEGEPYALRLDVDRVYNQFDELIFTDEFLGSVPVDPRPLGDVVIVRKDLPASYNLAVTLDDAADGVTHVTRGKDLLETTHIHRVLQELLSLPFRIGITMNCCSTMMEKSSPNGAVRPRSRIAGRAVKMGSRLPNNSGCKNSRLELERQRPI